MKKLNYRVKKCLNAFILYMVCSFLIFDYANAFLSPDQVYKNGRFDLAIESAYFRSTQNFDANGTQQTLLNSNSYQLINVNPQIRWGIFKDLGVRAGFNIATAESADLSATRKNSTFNRIDFGLDYLLIDSSGFQGIVDFEYAYAADKIATNTDSVINGPGASEIKPSLILRMPIEHLYPYGLIGINYRSEGLSTLLTYGLGAEYHFSEIGLGAALKGYSTIKNDDNSNNTSIRDTITTRVNAGSKKFYSINPNLLTTEMFLKFLVTDNTMIKAFANYDVYGSNIAQGFTVGATLTLSIDSSLGFGQNSSYRTDNKPVPRKQNTNSVNRQNPTTHSKKNNNSTVIPRVSEEPTLFKEDTNDGVNQDYFKPVTPQKEEYIQPIDQNNSQIETAPHQNDSMSSSTDESLKNDLDQLGYTIKLRKKKKGQ